MLLVFLGVLAVMLTHNFFAATDSAHSYAHVWYLAESLYSRHEWPWHVAQLENGRAVMFPYALIPWLPTALVYPLFGDRAVTASMVLGALLLVTGVLYWRPAMRQPELLALLLLNPFFWNGLTQFQLATFWAFAACVFAFASYERGWTARAVLAGTAGVVAHPMMGIGALGLYTLYEAARVRSLPPPRWLAIAAASVLLASPAIVLFLQSPLLRDAPQSQVIYSAIENMERLSILALPLLVGVVGRIFTRFAVVALPVGLVLTALAFMQEAPIGLWMYPQPRFTSYLQAHPIVSGAAYRVLLPRKHEDGAVRELMRAGAVLSYEFFAEAEAYQPFHDLDGYVCLLATRSVDRVILGGDYIAQGRSSEPALLKQLTVQGLAELEYEGADGTLSYVTRPPAGAARASLRDCNF